MTMALAGWAIERAMAAVLPSRSADRRAIAPRHLADDVGDSQPSALLPPRALLRISPPAIPRYNPSRITTDASIRLCHLKFIQVVAQWLHPRAGSAHPAVNESRARWR